MAREQRKYALEMFGEEPQPQGRIVTADDETFAKFVAGKDGKLPVFRNKII